MISATCVNGVRSALQKSAHQRIFATAALTVHDRGAAAAKHGPLMAADTLSPSWKFRWAQGHQFQSFRGRTCASTAHQEQLPILDEQTSLVDINRLSRMPGRPKEKSTRRRFPGLFEDEDSLAQTNELAAKLVALQVKANMMYI